MQSPITLLDKPVADLVDLAPGLLFNLQELLSAEGAQFKRRRETFDALMLRLFEDRARNAYQAARKDTGTVHAPASNTIDLTVEVDKTVVWDQDTLRTVLDEMSPDDARFYAKVTLEIPEAKFKSAPPAMTTAFAAARTVKPGRMKFTLKPLKVEENA